MLSKVGVAILTFERRDEGICADMNCDAEVEGGEMDATTGSKFLPAYL